jgi:hypothetical protein
VRWVRCKSEVMADDDNTRRMFTEQEMRTYNPQTCPA